MSVIAPSTTFDPRVFDSITLSESLSKLRETYFRAVPEICSERPKLITRFSIEAGLFGRNRISQLEKARLYRRVLERRTPIVWHRSANERTCDGMASFSFDQVTPFAGSTTQKFKGVPIYPEFMALAIWPELRTISHREKNPYFIDEATITELNEEVFPFWMDHSLIELARVAANDEERARLQLLQTLVFFLASKPECISHTIPDFSWAISLGLRAMVDQARESMRRASDEGEREFHAAQVEVLEGIIAYAKQIALEATKQYSSEPNAERRRALIEISEIYQRVPERPASSFREALTTIWICWTAIHLENPNIGLSLGRLDQILWTWYANDLNQGALTRPEAVELLCHFWLKIGDHVPLIPNAGEQLFGGTGSNQAITIGGVDTAGRDAVNELTYAILYAIKLMKLRDPNLNARFHPDVNDDRYLRAMCEANLSTGATPAIHNDRAVIKALCAHQHTLEQARDYGIVGCVEPVSAGRCYSHSGALLLNLPSVLELALFNGRHRHLKQQVPFRIETGDPASFQNFEQFCRAFEQQLIWVTDQAVAVNELLGRTHQSFYPTPILSAFFEGPKQNAKDLIFGSAIINASGVAVIGLADVADSLTAIKTLVFDEQQITMTELVEMVSHNFHFDAPYPESDKYRLVWSRLMDAKRTPRFGNDDVRADQQAEWLVRIIHQTLAPRKNYRGGSYTAGYWTMTNHAGFSRLLGAMPSGRRGPYSDAEGASHVDLLASGITPVSGVTDGLTPMLHSVAALPVECIGNGMALNLKFTPHTSEHEQMLDEFVSVVKGYFAIPPNGGMEIQFNVTSREEFMRALESYRRAESVESAHNPFDSLLVRVSGYTAYFKDLTPLMQKEIIDRTEYDLHTGLAAKYPPFELPTEGTVA